MIARRRMLAGLIALGIAFAGMPARAAVVMTFWSHELGNSFPHAFFTLRGVPDSGGARVDTDWGFTPVAITPKILFGPVRGAVEHAKPEYLRGSDAQFSIVLTDAQYAAVLALVEEWGEKGDPTYRINSRNCVHFIREAARRGGLATVDFPALMKKPRSYLRAVAAANPARVTIIERHGKDYLPSLAAAAATP